MDTGRLGMGAHALTPDAHGRDDLIHAQLGQRPDGIGRVDDDLVEALGRRRPEQVALGVGRRRLGVAVSAPDTGSGTTLTLQPGVSGGLPWGRRANSSGGVRSSWPPANGSCSGSMRLRRGSSQLPARPGGALPGHDHTLAGQRIYAELGHSAPFPLRCTSPSRCARSPPP